MLSGEAANTSFIVFSFTRPGSTTLEAGKLTIRPPMRFSLIMYQKAGLQSLYKFHISKF
jgi:hypothetical protein